MADLTEILGGPWKPPKPKAVDPPEIQFVEAIKSTGLPPPEEVVIDGEIHRFNTTNAKKTGWYVVYPNKGIPAGIFGCWREDISQKWVHDIGRPLTAVETMDVKNSLSKARAIKEKERRQRYEVAENVVEQIWSAGALASPDHPYLLKKSIKPHGSRVTGDGRLMVPLINESGELSSIQYISEDGSKLYHSGAKTGHCTWMVGGDNGETLYIAEGFATAASIHEATGQPCVVAYSASNLVEATRQARAKDGRRDIVIVADHDKNGIGKKYAEQAGAKHGARVLVMPNEGQDANDYAQAGGDLKALLEPKSDGWLIPADDFANQPAPIKWWVKHWIQQEAMIMVHGPSGGGKTFLVLEWVLTAAAGIEEWCGKKVRHCPVVYLAGEGHHGMRSRVAAWKHARGVDRLDMWISRAGTDLNTPEGLAYTRGAIQALPKPPGIIVVDTLHRFLNGDENSAQDAKLMQDACATLMQEFGCTVILVHHTGVSAEAQHRARGSSAWRGNLEIEISVAPGENGGPIGVIQRKVKDGEEQSPLYFDLDPVVIPGWFDEDNEPVCSAVLTQADTPKKGRPGSEQEWIGWLRQAWHRGHREKMEAMPYISRSVLREVLADAGKTQAAILKLLQPKTKRMIGTLMASGTLQERGSGWILTDPAVGAAWNLEAGDD